MSGPQYIFLGLIAITTWGAFVEAMAYPRYRRTFSRSLLALFVPVLWAVLIIFLPWDTWAGVLRHSFVWPVLLVLLVAGAPAWFVATIVIWVGASLCGDLQRSLHGLAQRFSKRESNKP